MSASAALKIGRWRDVEEACAALALVSLRFVDTVGVGIATVECGVLALIDLLLAYSTWPAGTTIFEALFALALVSVLKVGAVGVLMTVVQMRQLAFVHH